MLLYVERQSRVSSDLDAALARNVSEALRRQLMVTPKVRVEDPGELPRTFGKSKRVLDQRNED